MKRIIIECLDCGCKIDFLSIRYNIHDLYVCPSYSCRSIMVKVSEEEVPTRTCTQELSSMEMIIANSGDLCRRHAHLLDVCYDAHSSITVREHFRLMMEVYLIEWHLVDRGFTTLEVFDQMRNHALLRHMPKKVTHV